MHDYVKWSARSTGQCTSNLKSVNTYSTTRFHLGLIQIQLCGTLYTSEKRPHIHVINDDMFGCSYEPPNTNLAQMPDGWASTTRESFLRGYGNELAAARRGSKSGAKSSSRTCIITAHFSECVTQLEHMRWHTAAKGW